MFTRGLRGGGMWLLVHSGISFQIVFEVKNGKSFPGDIAIDDVNVGACSGMQVNKFSYLKIFKCL